MIQIYSFFDETHVDDPLFNSSRYSFNLKMNSFECQTSKDDELSVYVQPSLPHRLTSSHIFLFLIAKLCFICSIFSDAMDWQSMPTNSDEIVVYPVRGGHQSGSSQIKVKNIVDSTWDKTFQWGNLVATHFKGQYFAYALKGNLLLSKYFLTPTDYFFL